MNTKNLSMIMICFCVLGAGCSGGQQVSAAFVRAVIDTRAGQLKENSQQVYAVADRSISGPAGPVPVRIYSPGGNGPFPVLVYCHGGGWMAGSIETHDNVCRLLAREVGCVVVSVGYRLSPGYKFPVAVNEVFAVLKWVHANAAEMQVDAGRIAVGGSSAGGNIAAAICLKARDEGGPALSFQLLVFPATNLSAFDTASYNRYARGYGLTRAQMQWFCKHYLKNPEDSQNPYASPLLADSVAGLPPAYIVTGEFDVLRDEGAAYADRLQRAGVAATLKQYDGIGHAALAWGAASREVSPVISDVVTALHGALSR